MCAKSIQSCPTLHNPTDCSLPGSSVHGILSVSDPNNRSKSLNFKLAVRSMIFSAIFLTSLVAFLGFLEEVFHISPGYPFKT